MANSFGNLVNKVMGNSSGISSRTDTSKAQRVTRTSQSAYVDDQTVDGWISDKWEKVRTSYLTYHQLIWQSILFYVGQTWLTWDPYRKYYYPTVPEDEFT